MKIKKIDFNLIKRLGPDIWRRGWRYLLSLPRLLLIQHSHVLDVTAVVLVLALSAYLLLWMLYFKPPGLNIQSAAQYGLSIDAIDRLEFWIEEVESERAKELNMPGGKIFED